MIMRSRRGVVVTDHEESVTRITRVTEDQHAAEAARSILFARLRKQRAVKIDRWTRVGLYNEVL